MLRLAKYAKPIADARKAGKRPAAMIVIADGVRGLHRRYPLNPVISIEEEDNPATFDWWFLADLDVEIATCGDADRIASLVAAVMTGSPGYLRVWRLDTGACTRIWFLGTEWNTPEVIHETA